MNCAHWSPSNRAGSGLCSANHFGGRPSLGTCHRCPHATGDGPELPAPMGLGGHVARVLTSLGAEKCGGCTKREKELDELGRKAGIG